MARAIAVLLTLLAVSACESTHFSITGTGSAAPLAQALFQAAAPHRGTCSDFRGKPETASYQERYVECGRTVVRGRRVYVEEPYRRFDGSLRSTCR